jgi:quercetin dioxygenase-like cupin family protein
MNHPNHPTNPSFNRLPLGSGDCASGSSSATRLRCLGLLASSLICFRALTPTVANGERSPARSARVQARRIQILPGHAAGLHGAHGPVIGSVLRSSVVFQIQGEPASVLRPGDVFFEPEGARIARFDAQDDGVTFLAYFLLGPGQEPEISFPDDK